MECDIPYQKKVHNLETGQKTARTADKFIKKSDSARKWSFVDFLEFNFIGIVSMTHKQAGIVFRDSMDFAGRRS